MTGILLTATGAGEAAGDILTQAGILPITDIMVVCMLTVTITGMANAVITIHQSWAEEVQDQVVPGRLPEAMILLH